ncbi:MULTISPECIES: hypothetical protein [unclassified Symbiopectobacterium]|uniref:hypothetical protein n=2 Tax=Symbiopectobacterium TaxID=801 RepID=UPI0022279C21|nr:MULTISPECIES: hypothetical protein [unclassified Symbiopectobacterium]MCW2477103.1 hypothetical protein [Candidatus Symbiopectobacterium sp. NZEC151]MCW2488551.1 hypothetical protein [Candidatus Symbiopectobacterium sp. NZEC127]
MKIMTGKPVFFAASTLFLSLLLVGCQSATRSLPDSAAGNSGNSASAGLEFAGQTCRTDPLYAASGGPDALYAEMNACVRAQKFDRAVFLYALAGSYTWFDASRIGTQYAKMAHGKRLGEALAQLSEKQVSQFWERIRATMQDPGKKTMICDKVKLAGMPTHSIDYMRVEKSSGVAAKPREQHQWEMSVNNYLLCK